MKNVNNSKLRIIPLGGLEQVGMNITAFEFEDSIIVVDCGLAFPEDEMLGIDLVIPDVSYLKQNNFLRCIYLFSDSNLQGQPRSKFRLNRQREIAKAILIHNQIAMS